MHCGIEKRAKYEPQCIYFVLLSDPHAIHHIWDILLLVLNLIDDDQGVLGSQLTRFWLIFLKPDAKYLAKLNFKKPFFCQRVNQKVNIPDKIPAKIELFIIPTDFTQNANSVISKFIFLHLLWNLLHQKIINSNCLILFKGDPGKILPNRRVRLNLEAFILLH